MMRQGKGRSHMNIPSPGVVENLLDPQDAHFLGSFRKPIWFKLIASLYWLIAMKRNELAIK
jgi:hypothetical protein